MMSFLQKTRPQTSSTRAGAITAMVLVVLIVLSMLTVAVVRRVLTERQHTRGESHRIQTQQLVEAGFLRIQQAVAADPAFSGDTWKLAQGTLHPRHSAEVEMTRGDNGWTVTARFPAQEEFPVQITQTRKLDE